MPFYRDTTLFDNGLNEFLDGELGRIVSSVVVVLVAMTLSHLNMRYYTSPARAKTKRSHSRQQLVLIKNIIILSAVLMIVIIWATKIAGVAISLSAFAVALVLSTKELIMCITGYILFVMSRPFNVGDLIEVNGSQGLVVDVGLLNLTLSETNGSQQITGKTIVLPNSILLTAVVTNHVGLGRYVVGSVRLAVPYSTDRNSFNQIALKVATKLCDPWATDSVQHFQRLGTKALLDAPSNKVEIFWEPLDVKQHWVEIRFFVPASQQELLAQQIQHDIWLEYGAELSAAAAKI